MSVAVAKPFAARPRNQSPTASRPQQQQHQRGAPSTPRSAVPGILHLPSPKSASPSRSSAPSLASRHSAPTGSTVTLPLAERSAASPRPRRTRGAKSKLSGPSEAAPVSGTDTDEAVPLPSSRPRRNRSKPSAEGAAVASPLVKATASTPTRPPRRERDRAKQSRQRSPPNTIQDDDDDDTDEVVEYVAPLSRPRPVPLPLPTPNTGDIGSAPADLWADNPAMALLSKSAPALGIAFPQHAQRPPSTPGSKATSRPQKPYNATSSSADESSWDMPVISSTKNAGTKLTWQQTSLSNTAPQSTPTKAASRRPQSARQPGQKQFAKQQLQSLHPTPTSSALSESAPTSTNDGLTWQQRQLLGPRAAHGHSNSFSGVTADLHAPLEGPAFPSSPSATITATSAPQRSRRAQLRDAETFGLDSPVTEDAFTAPIPSSSVSSKVLHPASPGKKAQQQQQQRKSPGKGSVSAPVLPTEARYAGPTFHNSPPPEMLPLPSFMLRRKLRGMGFSL